MYDFLRIEGVEKRTSREYTITIQPEFDVNLRTKDLMIRGGDFYAIWDEEAGLWSTDEQTVIDNVDKELKRYRNELPNPEKYDKIIVLYMRRSSSGQIDKWHKFVQKQMRDVFKPLNQKVIFSNQKTKRSDYASFVLPYPIEKGDISAYDEAMNVWFDEDNRRKVEWSFGAVLDGASKRIQKFSVFYGPPKSGKSSVLGLFQKMLSVDPDDDNDKRKYVSSWDSKSMGSGNPFSTDSFKNHPLLSIQHDGNLSRIEDNAMLNSIVSHEVMGVNPKYAKMYEAKFSTYLMLGTNSPVRITDSKSGILRRLIDIRPTGDRIDRRRYDQLQSQIKFEYGAIAYHCLHVFRKLGETYYDDYTPFEMMEETNNFYNFMEHCYDDFLEKDHVTLVEAWKRYCEYCEFVGCYRMEQKTMSIELKSYFREYKERARIDGVQVRRLYCGFRSDKFQSEEENGEPESVPDSSSDDTDADLDLPGWLIFKEQPSWFDSAYADWPAQYEKDYGKGGQPEQAWAKCKTKLRDLDTKMIHYAKPMHNYTLVMIDFDLRNENGEKDLRLNLEAASHWPKTYAEVSKSGCGIHLYYIYSGDISKLSHIYAPGIEVKTFTGNSAIRRKLTACNDIPVATLKGGLPLRKEKDKKVNWEGYKDAKHLHRHIVTEIQKNLRKEVHADTTSSIHMIKKILDDAYESGIPYNVTDLYPAVRDFAANSTNQSEHCLECVTDMHFKSETPPEEVEGGSEAPDEGPPIVIDIEIYPPGVDEDGEDNPGLFLICWKYYGADPASTVSMVNPSSEEVEALLHYGMIGYNILTYDSTMIMARSMGKSNAQLYNLSNRLVNAHDNSAQMYESRKMVTYDVYEYCKAAGKSQSLKAWEIELGQSHMEMGIPWDKPAPRRMWPDIIEYCKNDVVATEAVYDATKGYRMARDFQVNLVKALHGDDIPVRPADTANTLTKRAIFGKNKEPQNEFNYRNLALPVGSDQYEAYLQKFGSDYRFRVWNDKGLPEYRDYIPGEVLPDGWSILPFFPGYEFNPDAPKSEMSTFHGDHGGEGGRVYSDPGMYVNVWDGDIASQYPHSIMAEMLFGPKYTKIFAEIVQARIAVKHKDFETAATLLGGALKPFLSEDTAADLAQGMKIIINAVYGLTKAGFKNEFRDPRNIDNIVAKRGNLFMLVLKEQIEARGYKVCHIKTDSIKIPNATQEIKDFVIKFGREYGYEFETEGEFAKFVLLNDAAYVAYDKKEGWITKAKQFQEPYVKKTLFTKEPITFDDVCQTFNVREGSLYLDLNENLESFDDAYEAACKKYQRLVNKATKKLHSMRCTDNWITSFLCGEDRAIAYLQSNPDPDLQKMLEDVWNQRTECDDLYSKIDSGHNYQFIGRVGRFCPIKAGCGGGILYRVQNGKNYAAPGTTGYRWLEAEYVKKYGLEEKIDISYFTELVDEAAEAICKYGDLDWFINGDDNEPVPDFINVPEGTDEEVPF